VSLKYWQTKAECISDWQKGDLAKFSRAVDKIQTLTLAKMKADSGLYWKPHAGKAAHGFSRPSELSDDVNLFEVRVASKARLHAAVVDNVFFLIWLDRNHGVFPEK